MILKEGQHVKLLFRNGVTAEGTVIFWEPNSYKLESLDKKSILIIHNLDDIMITKIVLNQDQFIQENKQENKQENETSLDFLDEIIKKRSKNNPQFQQMIEDAALHQSEQNLTAQDLRAKKLVELQQTKAKIEREEISAKLRNHHIGEIKPTNYGYPSYLNKIKGK
jgi:hypothetical protein